MASSALDKLKQLMSKGFEVDSMDADWIAEVGVEVVTVHLHKKGKGNTDIKASVRARDKDFCDYAMQILPPS
jgi:hypothetical protein